MEVFGEGFRALKGIELYRKINRVNKPGPLGAFRDGTTNQRAYIGWTWALNTYVAVYRVPQQLEQGCSKSCCLSV